MIESNSGSEAAVKKRGRYLTAIEAAEYLRVSLSWLRRATRAREVPHAMLGRRRLYDRQDLDAYVTFKKSGGQWGR